MIAPFPFGVLFPAFHVHYSVSSPETVLASCSCSCQPEGQGGHPSSPGSAMGQRCVGSEPGGADGRKAAGTEGSDCAEHSGSLDGWRGQARGSAAFLSWAARRGCRMRMGGGGRQPRAPVFPARSLQAISQQSLLSPVPHLPCFFFSPATCPSSSENTCQGADLGL